MVGTPNRTVQYQIRVNSDDAGFQAFLEERLAVQSNVGLASARRFRDALTLLFPDKQFTVDVISVSQSRRVAKL